MKIDSIEIEGFWSYRDRQHIDISDLPLVVGVGENGTGKSTLLVSSIVAAFYGKFPTTTIEESITDGAAQGHVSVEFTIGADRYRVGRLYPRTGTASGVVAISDPAQKTGWRTVTEKGIREVNAYMVQLLGMDYNTAAMTWIAEQGQYGRFAAAAPAERFKLLSSVFGLDEYTAKAKLATAAAAVVDKEIDQLDGRINELGELLEPEVDEFAEPQGLAALGDDALSERADEANIGIDRIGEELASLASADPRKLNVETRQALDLVRNERLNALTAAEATRERAAQTKSQAQSRHDATVSQAQSRHDTTVSQADIRAQRIREDAERGRVAAVAALAEIAATKRDLHILADTATGHREAAEDARERAGTAGLAASVARTAHGVLKSEWASTKAATAALEERIAKLGSFASGTHAECYACGQHLDADDAAALIGAQRSEVETIAARQIVIKAEGGLASAVADQAEAEQAELISAAKASDDQARTAAATLSRAETLIATQAERQEQADTADISANRAGLERDSAVAAAAAERDSVVSAADDEVAEVVGCAEVELAAATLVIDANANPQAEESRLSVALATAEAAVAGAAQDIDLRRTALDDERRAFRAIAVEVEREIARRAAVAAAEVEQRGRLDAAVARRSVFAGKKVVADTLVRAYSPSGIPAMILSGVIDELNEAVNVSLDRLSRGELAIQLRTSRESSSGTTVNKISVYVETSSGTRAYETLSGGQKFRVDLALRTGLSKVISRGTGTPIQTFILDEGWGSLDEKGLLATFDTLFRLSEETNVITVSHIPSVKETFPARVEVTAVGGNAVAEVIR